MPEPQLYRSNLSVGLQTALQFPAQQHLHEHIVPLIRCLQDLGLRVEKRYQVSTMLRNSVAPARYRPGKIIHKLIQQKIFKIQLKIQNQ